MVRIEGIDRVEMPQPPEDLLDDLTLSLVRMGFKLRDGDYYRKVRISDETGIREIPSEDLLPDHMRALYGYSRDIRAKDTGCHAVAVMFNCPNMFAFESPKAALEAEFQPLMKDGVPTMGDVVVIKNVRSKTTMGVEPVAIVHSMVYIDDDLVVSKNGNGHEAPLFVQPMNQLVSSYGVKPDHPTVKTEIEYWRKKT